MDSFELRLAGEGVSPETVSLSELAQLLEHLARISAEKPVPPPSAAQTITGPTTLYGVLVKIGGAHSSKAEIRLHGKNDQLISVSVDRGQATLLAKRLYRDVCLEGEATWLMPAMTVVSFWPTKIVDFTAPDAKTGFDELRAQVGGAWDGIDVDKFMNDQRADDEGGTARAV